MHEHQLKKYTTLGALPACQAFLCVEVRVMQVQGGQAHQPPVPWLLDQLQMPTHAHGTVPANDKVI